MVNYILEVCIWLPPLFECCILHIRHSMLMQGKSTTATCMYSLWYMPTPQWFSFFSSANKSWLVFFHSALRFVMKIVSSKIVSSKSDSMLWIIWCRHVSVTQIIFALKNLLSWRIPSICGINHSTLCNIKVNLLWITFHCFTWNNEWRHTL